MKLTRLLIAMLLAVLIALPAQAETNTPLASKDGTDFVLEDLHIYWLRNLGKGSRKSTHPSSARNFVQNRE